MENKFELNNLYYQDTIEIKDKTLIRDFYEKHIEFLKNDIIDFENHYKNFEISKAVELVIWVSDVHDDKIEFDSYYLMEDNTKTYFYIKFDDMIAWLKEHDLIV